MASILSIGEIRGLNENSNVVTVPSGHTLNIGTRSLEASTPYLVAYAAYTNSVSSSTWASLGSWSTSNDTHSWFSASTGRYTPQIAGWYLVSAARRHGYSGVGESGQHYIAVFKNGNNVGEPAGFSQGSGGYPSWWVHKTVFLNGTTDYVEMKMYDSVAQSNVGGVLESVLIREAE